MKLLAVILYAALRLLEYGATDPAHSYDPAGAVVTETVLLHNRVKYKLEERVDWMITEAVVIEWWSNGTACVSGNRIETRWYR